MRLSAPSTVDGALKALTQAMEDLDRIRQAQSISAALHHAALQAAEGEAQRATRICEKLKDLLA